MLIFSFLILVKGLYFLELNNITNQCIRPQTISIIQKERKIIPIIHDAVFVKTIKNSAAIHSDRGNRKKHYYISPVLLKAIAEQQHGTPPYDLYRSDVFSLGMTLLHAGTLTAMDHVYNYFTGLIEEEELKNRLNELREHYSESLCKIVENMLVLQDELRMNFKKLKESIEKGFDVEFQQQEESQEQIVLGQSFYIRQNADISKELFQVINLQQKIENNEKLEESSKNNDQQKISTAGFLSSIKQAIEKSFRYDDSEEENEEPQNNQKKYSQNNFLGILSESSSKQPIRKSQTQKEKQPDRQQQQQQNNNQVKQKEKAKTLTQKSLPSDIFLKKLPNTKLKMTTEHIQEENEFSRSQQNCTIQLEMDNELQSMSDKLSNHQPDFDSIYDQNFRRQIIEDYPQIIITAPKVEEKQDSLTKSIEKQQQSLTNKNQSKTESLKRNIATSKDKNYINSSESYSNQSILDFEGLYHSQSIHFTNNQKQTIKHNEDIDDQSNIQYIKEKNRPNSHHIQRNIPKYKKSQNERSSIVNGEKYYYLNLQETLNDGTKYFGEKSYGMKQGWGKKTFKNQAIYEGQWNNDQMDGIGTLYYSGGKIAYEGYWKENQFHGQGTLYNDHPRNDYVCYKDLNQINEYFNLNLKFISCWLKYVGGFNKDQRDGFGTIYFANCEKFECNFSEDQALGSGIFFRKDGTTIKGFWKNNVLQDFH